MWIIKYINCLIRGHSYVDVNLEKEPYHYCLNCCKVEVPDESVRDRRCGNVSGR